MRKGNCAKWVTAVLILACLLFLQPPPLPVAEAASSVIRLNYTKKTIRVGSKLRLKTTITKNSLKKKTIVWKSNNPSIASVTKKGVVKAKSKGAARITATIKGTGHRASCVVHVKKKKTVDSQQYPENQDSETYHPEDQNSEDYRPEDQILETYYIVGEGTDFSENRAWVGYQNRKLESEIGFGVIDTSGKLLYSVDISGLSEDIQNGNSDFTEIKEIEVTNFQDGFSCYYGSGGTPGFVIVDKDGAVTYRSADGDDSTEMFFWGYDNNSFFVLKHVFGISENNYYFYTIDGYGNKQNDEIQIDQEQFESLTGETMEGKFTYLGDGIFALEDESKVTRSIIYNQVTNQLIDVRDYIRGISKEVNQGCVVAEGGRADEEEGWVDGGYVIPISALQSQETFEQTVARGLTELPGWCKTTIREGMYYSTVDECYYDINGKQAFSMPDFGEGVELRNATFFSGGYAAILLLGVDDNDYVTLLDKTGEVVYEPIKLAYASDIDICKGYIKIGDTEYIGPDGEDVDIRYVDDEEVLAHFLDYHCGLAYVPPPLFALVHEDEAVTWYEDVYKNRIIERVYQTGATNVE